MQGTDVERLLKHMEWADAVMWKTVLNLSESQTDKRLLERLHHLHSVQWVYLQMWRREPMQVPELSSLPDLGAVARWARPYYPQLVSLVHGLDSKALSETVEFPWAAEVVKRLGSAGPATLGESILHVVLHSTYHRGQVATRIREVGGEPPLTDFIAWLWKERPEPEW